MSQDFAKVVRIGDIDLGTVRPAPVFCKIEFKGGKLSISGVEGPLRSGDARGSCGQIVMHLKPADFTSFAPGWDADKAARFLAVWDEWHLNSMQAGSPAQRAHLKANPIDYAYPKSHFEAAKDKLAEAGLEPDASHLRDGKPYSYGSAWLNAEVPKDALAFLQSLPDTDVTPAWV